MTTNVSWKISGVIDKQHVTQIVDIDKHDAKHLKLNLAFEKGWVVLLVWDPNGKLRAQYVYVNEEEATIYISEDKSASSFSTVPGEITPGEWVIEMFIAKKDNRFTIEVETGTERLMGESTEAKNYWSTVSDANSFRLIDFQADKIYQTEKKWYKGDFHTHTTLSDGKLTPELGMVQAKKQGLDFFVATDHQVVPTTWVGDEDMLVIPGIEVTSSKGHFNALGLTSWIDWRPTRPDGGMESEQGMNEILREVKEAKGLRSINHPLLRPWEWQFTETDLHEVDVIEIWNDPTFKDNIEATEGALRLWDTLLADGYRIYGIGGSDSHLLPTESYEEDGPPSLIGDPATYVLADQLSAQNVLQAVAEGKVYVSRRPELDIHITTNEKEVELGEEFSGDMVTFQVNYRHMPIGAKANWVVGGELQESQSILDESGQLMNNIDCQKQDFMWIRLEIRNANNELLAFTNPVFKGGKKPTIRTWGELQQKAGISY